MIWDLCKKCAVTKTWWLVWWKPRQGGCKRCQPRKLLRAIGLCLCWPQRRTYILSTRTPQMAGCWEANPTWWKSRSPDSTSASCPSPPWFAGSVTATGASSAWTPLPALTTACPSPSHNHCQPRLFNEWLPSWRLAKWQQSGSCLKPTASWSEQTMQERHFDSTERSMQKPGIPFASSKCKTEKWSFAPVGCFFGGGLATIDGRCNSTSG